MKLTLIMGLALTALACSPQRNSVENLTGSSANILNGQSLSESSPFPAQRSVIMIQFWKGEVPGVWCTAVLIGKNVGLTAAHCVEKYLVSWDHFKVVFGLTPYALEDKKLAGVDHVTHPRYQTETITTETFNFTTDPTLAVPMSLNRRFDLSVFSFKGTLPPGAQPAVLDTDISADRSGERVYVYGAGTAYHPAESMIHAKAGERIVGVLKRGQMIIGPGYTSLEDLYFSSIDSPNQVCNGDSGGPQFLATADVPTIVGINSARFNNPAIASHQGSFCGDTSLGQKVAPFADWILATQHTLEEALQAQIKK